MNTKKFVLWQLKKWLPLIIVTTVALASFFAIFCLSTSTYHQETTYYYGVTSTGWTNSPTAGIFYAGFVFTFILPWAALNYHFKKTSADAFRQFPADDRKIRNIRFLLGFAVLVFGFTIAYLFGMMLFGLRWLSTQEIFQISENTNRVRNSYNWVMFIVEYFFMLIAYFLEYSFNAYLISLCGTKNAALVMMLTGNIVLTFIAFAPFLTITSSSEVFGLMGGIANYGILFHGTVDAAAIGNSLSGNAMLKAAYAMGVFDLIVSGGAAYLFLSGREASGEYFGAPGSRYKWASIIIDASLIVSLIVLGSTLSKSGGSWTSSPYLYLLAIPGLALHYAAISLFNKSGKLTTRGWIVMASGIVVFLLASVIAMN